MSAHPVKYSLKMCLMDLLINNAVNSSWNSISECSIVYFKNSVLYD